MKSTEILADGFARVRENVWTVHRRIAAGVIGVGALAAWLIFGVPLLPRFQ